ncbi:low affinity immunoglobulin epsilon Fc receptor-like [Ptychodera flava]|uniref:low affinity immunoglobulin epsilon Fc receptor-like n=1 Tax=Ptychodera flava TaxID=63121 RepID=UPI003969C28C
MCMKYEIYCQQPNDDHNYNMNARQYCRSRSIEDLGPKGRLAIFRNETIASKVRQFIMDNDLHEPPCITKYGFWIGLSDRIHEGEYVWSDGVSLCHEDYRNWAPGEPNNNTNKKPSIGQDCVQLWFRFDNDGQWDDEYCDVKPKGFICEIPDPYCHSESST